MTKTPAKPEKKVNVKLYVAVLLTVILAGLGIGDAYNGIWRYIGIGKPISLEALLGGLLAVWGLFLLYQRTENQGRQLEIQTKELENQNEQINIQINKEIEDRFIAAVTLLGSGESSARTGAVYSLYELAMESKKYRKQIAQILCSHIRSKTQEKEYQAEYKKRPSNEIQTSIDILFKDVNGVKGLYCLGFSQVGDFPRANLSRAYLCGADFIKAECYGVDFSSAVCHHAKFCEAECENANFHAALCTAANFEEAQCQEADFSFARCYGAYFSQGNCEEAKFSYACCQGAYFDGTYLPFANFRFAKCQGTCFSVCEIEKAIFVGANFHGAHINPAHKLENRIQKDTEIKNVLDGSELTLKDAKVGVLEDSEEIRKIIAEIKKWEAL